MGFLPLRPSQIAVLAALLGASSICGATPARADPENWYNPFTNPCGGGGLGCALDHLLQQWGNNIVEVLDCWYGHNHDGQVTAAYCRGHWSSTGNAVSPAVEPPTVTASAIFEECAGGADQTGTGCSHENQKNRGCEEGNPVSATAGVKVEVATDFTTEGSQPLAFSRTYWSAVHYWGGPAANKARLGRGWRANFDASLWVDGYGRVYVILPDGREIRFELDGSTYTPRGYNPVTKSWAAAPNITHTLVANGSNWEVRQPDDSLLTFNSGGEFTSIKYRGGYTQTLTWVNGKNTQVTDNLGRTITFAYGVNGRLAEMTDPDGRKIKYEFEERADFASAYNPFGLPLSNVDHAEYVLTKVIYPDSTPGTDADNPAVQYHYEDSNYRFALTGLTDERGIRYATWTYDSTGRVATSQHAGGVDRHVFSYDFANGRTTVTNPLNKQTVYHFDRNVPGVSLLTKIEGKASTNCAAADTDFEYDENRFVKQFTDGERRITLIANDNRGLPTSITRGHESASPSTTTYTWHPTLHVPTQIVEPGLTTDLDWNPNNGRLKEVTQTDTTTHSVPYSTSGQTRVWTYTYTTDAAGLLASADGPLSGAGDTVFYTYNANGFVAMVTNEVGLVTTFTAWNGRGQPTSMTDPNGVVTSLAYDERGRLTEITVDPGANQARTSIAYNGPGDIEKITRPNDAYLEFKWDNARRLERITDKTGAYVEFDRDALGGITARRIKDSAGTIFLTQTATYDELGRLLTFVGAASQTWRIGYDRTDNLTAVTDPRSNVYRQAFDALNRLIGETAEDNGVVALERNGKDEITKYTDPRLLATSYVRNGFGEVIQRTSPDSGTTVYEYDYNNPLGKIVTMTDPRGLVTKLTHDTAGRLLTKEFLSNTEENFTLTWDQTGGGNKGKGRLTRVDGQNGTVFRRYNNLGQIDREMKELQGIQYPVLYSYDRDGNVTEMTYPSGRIVSYSRDSMGRIAGVTTQVNAAGPVVTLASGVLYREFGPLRQLTYGNNLILARHYTTDYRLDVLRVRKGDGTNIVHRAHSYADGINLTRVVESVSGRNEDYSYDPANRLATAAGPWGGTLSYTYDLVGNRTSEVFSATPGYSHTYSYPADSNRLASVTDGATAVRSFTYDAAGNITIDNRSGTNNRYFYNDRGRLKQYRLGNTVRANYRYDFFERINWRETLNMSPTGATHYVQDLAGRLIYEATSTGTPLREYVWLDDMPLAVFSDLDTTPQLYFVHPDHLDRPLRMTDATQAVVWDAVYRPFGEAVSITGTSSLNLRFPGQYFLIESGLAYNWHRHYDPTIGRYTQPDPMEFVDGPSRYAYASGSPMGKIDPDGTEIVLMVRPWWVSPWRWQNPFRVPPPPPNQPKPPGWTSDWKWQCPEGTSPQGPRWFDPKGGEWRWHKADRWHPESHWDYNPWTQWNSPWRNLDIHGREIPAIIGPPPFSCPPGHICS
jgi:RHS repeat-associated protein